MRRVAALAAVVILAAACGRGDDERSEVVPSPAGTPPALGGPLPSPTEQPSPTPTSESHSSGSVSAEERRTPAPARISLAQARVRLTRIATLSEPVALAVRRGDGALYIAEREGRVRSVRNGRVASGAVLDVSSEVVSGGEQGFLGIAFSPAGDKLYVNFTNNAGDTVVREYAFTSGRADVATAREVLRIDQPASNHNGGNLVFGPDGNLYIGMGDGGGGSGANSQDLESLLGKMLRIDPRATNGAAYRIPSGNPFVGRDGRDEIWALGLRNPWRYSFDRDTGDLYIGDVGGVAWEEIDYQPRSSRGGENYGWPLVEGTHRNLGAAPAGHDPPMYEYSHDGGNCSVTGGFVYRGGKIPNLDGAYVFGDYCAGRLRAFVPDGGRAKESRFLGPRVSSLSSFGEDASGNLYALSLDGPVYRIDRG